MRSNAPYEIGLLVAFALLAGLVLAAFSGSGTEESIARAPALANTEVAAPKIPGSKSGLSKRAAPTVGTKKARFLARVLPHIERENEQIARERSRLVALASSAPLSEAERAWVHRLAKEYRVRAAASDAALIDALLRRVDKLPPSLVLAQAAIESAWGTSRFAREGNNLFGQWCFTEGCGIVPAARAEDATHEVRRFDSLQDSIHGYFMNINTHRAYRPLREIRSCQRDQGMPLSGQALALGLERYSEIGERYIETVRAMIRVNRWESLDQAPLQLAVASFEEAQCPADELPGVGGTLVAAGE